ncbi:hypothetical protein N665_0201s0434 [Sinapis alba]|nr:hypothetical protein N665_0201s0434 [Sinapis alba]
MDSVFRSAREKLEKEHRERKETGKLKLEREKKDKEAAERQRQAVEASQRARRLEAIESQMKKDNLSEEKEEDVIPTGGGDCIIEAIPPWMKKNMPQRIAKEKDDDVFEWDDEEGAEWEVGDAPGTGNCKRFTWNVRAEEKKKKRRRREE